MYMLALHVSLRNNYSQTDYLLLIIATQANQQACLANAQYTNTVSNVHMLHQFAVNVLSFITYTHHSEVWLYNHTLFTMHVYRSLWLA